jgi:hypothetical protein
MKETLMTSPIIFETFLAPAWYKMYQYMTEFVERSIGVPTFLLNGEALEDFADAYTDVGFLTPLAYIQLLNQTPCPVELIVAPISLGEVQLGDIPPVFFDIVVRKESRITSANELEGCIWSYYTGMPHTEDQSLYEQCLPTASVKMMIETQTQAQALRLVLDGTADATAIDAHMLDLVYRNSPQMTERLRILSAYCPSTGPLVVVASHLGANVKRKIQEAFLRMHQDTFFAKRLREGSIDHFIPVTNSHYQSMSEHYRDTQAQIRFAEKAATSNYASAQV